MSKEMEEILKKLGAINKQLGDAIKEKNDYDFSDPKGTTTTGSVVESTVNNLANALKQQYQDAKMKNETELKNLLEKINAINETLKKFEKNKDINENKAYIDIKKLVKDFTENLTKRKEAIEKIKSDSKVIDEFKREIENQLSDYDRELKLNDDDLTTVAKFERGFQNEYGEYKSSKSKVDELKNLKKYADEIIKAESEYEKIKAKGSEDSIEENSKAIKRINETRDKFEKFKQNYEAKFGEIDIPDSKDLINFKDQYEKKFDIMSKEEETKLDNAKTKLAGKLTNLSPEILSALKLNTDDLTVESDKSNLEKVIEKIIKSKTNLMDERSQLQNKKELRKDTLDSIKGLDEAEKNVNDLNNKDDKDIASGKEAEKAIDDLIAKNFKDAKLPISINNIKDASRKELRKNLKSTVYEGKRFAGLRSFVMGTFKKTAYKKLRQNYKNKAVSDYANSVRKAAEQNRDNIKTRQESFKERIQNVKVENAINGRKAHNMDVYNRVIDDDLTK